jgi:membrane protein DedA with SNARE-associated domain
VADLSHLLDVAPAVVYLLAFLAAWLESAPAIGLIVPGQSIIVATGFLAGQGRADPFLLAAVVAVGGFSGDSLGYVAGRGWGVAPLQKLPGRLRLTEGGRARLAFLFASHGGKAVVLARFQPIGRAFGPYLAGATGMRAARFLTAAGIASLLAAGALVGLGYIAGLGFARLSHELGITVVTVVTVALVGLGYFGLRATRTQRGEEPPVGPL